MKALIEFIRRWKISYTLYNFFHQSQLMHNRAAYQQYGLRKALYSPLDSTQLTHLPKGEAPWLDQMNKQELLQNAHFQSFSSDWQEQILFWNENGYIILPQFFDADLVASVNAEIEQLLAKKEIQFRYGNKLMFVNKKSKLVQQITTEPRLLELLKVFLGMEAVPFQTINFLEGSQQKAHSDSVHMTTHPQGYLIAAWIALEDVAAEQGALFYYPKSHKLPYILNPDFPNGSNAWMLGKDAYKNYENRIQELVNQHSFEKKILEVKAGDILIWHANLLHGGEPITRKGSTRKSMVIHYFGKEVIKYHEITQRPALLEF